MNAMRIFGYNAQRNITYHIMSEIDKTESGKIQFEEFLKIMIDNLRPCDTDKQEDYPKTPKPHHQVQLLIQAKL